MIAEALLLVSAWSWAPMHHGQALVCRTSHLNQCIAQLPEKVRSQLPRDLRLLIQQMGRRGAMVKPLSHPDVSGVVLINEGDIPTAYSALWDGKVFALPVEHTFAMTLRHELGHLAVTRSLSPYLKDKSLSAYQHEWLADFYLLWSLARDEQDSKLAWQQYHRRNLEVFESVSALSHWTTPMLSQLMAKYSWQQLGKFSDFDSLITALYPQLRQYEPEELDEFASLIQRVFGAGAMHDLPHYMFWRRAEMGHWIRPTMERLMGEQDAQRWLAEQAMSGES